MKKEVLPALQTGGLGDYPFNRIGTEVGRLSAPTHPIGCLYLGGGGVVKIKPQSKGLTGRSVCFNCFISVASFPPSCKPAVSEVYYPGKWKRCWLTVIVAIRQRFFYLFIFVLLSFLPVVVR